MQRHVFIATPCHSGEVRCEFVRSLVSTLPLLFQNGIAFTQSFCIGNALVHVARNSMVAWFMAQKDATDLLFIDADMAWEPECALRLALSPHDVIGGAYLQKREGQEIYNVAPYRGTATTLIECDYLATGFLKISRRAVERLIKAHPETKYLDSHGYECHGLFDTSLGEGKVIGEDALFCRRWRALGGKILCDPDMTITHIGTKPYTGNFADLILREGSKPEGEAA
jgi:hypothetical protein